MENIKNIEDLRLHILEFGKIKFKVGKRTYRCEHNYHGVKYKYFISSYILSEHIMVGAHSERNKFYTEEDKFLKAVMRLLKK